MERNITMNLLGALRQTPQWLVILILVIAPATHQGRAEAPVDANVVEEVITNPTTRELDKIHAAKIDAFLGQWNLPLAGHGSTFVEAANTNNIPWNLLAAISFIETTGGKFACKNPKAAYNAYGWGSCRNGFGFDSWDDGINTVSVHLGGNHENTDQYYSDKTTREILEAYNPPSVIPGYADKVMRVMHQIESMNIE